MAHPSPLVLKRACTESSPLPAASAPRPCPSRGEHRGHGAKGRRRPQPLHDIADIDAIAETTVSLTWQSPLSLPANSASSTACRAGQLYRISRPWPLARHLPRPTSGPKSRPFPSPAPAVLTAPPPAQPALSYTSEKLTPPLPLEPFRSAEPSDWQETLRCHRHWLRTRRR